MGSGGGKWALVGGSGAFWEGATGKFDFARSEAIYDLAINLDVWQLKYFTHRLKSEDKLLILELYFSYELPLTQEVGVTSNEKAPDDCRWFSIEKINEMAERGEIAFNNHEIVQEFEKQILK